MGIQERPCHATNGEGLRPSGDSLYEAQVLVDIAADPRRHRDGAPSVNAGRHSDGVHGGLQDRNGIAADGE